MSVDSFSSLATSEQLELMIRMFSQVTRLFWGLGGVTAGVLLTLLVLQVIAYRHSALSADPLQAPGFPGDSYTASSDQWVENREDRQRMDSLAQDMQKLTAAVAGIQNSYLDTQAAKDSPGVPAPQQSAVTASHTTAAAAELSGLEALPVAPTDSSANVTPDTTATPAYAVVPHDEWLINLAALPSKDAAERMVAAAEAHNIPARLHTTILDGKTFWRVQATGFNSFTQAKSSVNTIEEKLGTKDAWVMERTD